MQRYGQCTNGYVYDGKSEVAGGTAAGLVLQLLLRGSVSLEDIVEGDAAFLRRRCSTGGGEHPTVTVEVQLSKGDEPLFAAVSKHGGFLDDAKRPATIASLSAQFGKLFDVPAACVSPRSTR